MDLINSEVFFSLFIVSSVVMNFLIKNEEDDGPIHLLGLFAYFFDTSNLTKLGLIFRWIALISGVLALLTYFFFEI